MVQLTRENPHTLLLVNPGTPQAPSSHAVLTKKQLDTVKALRLAAPKQAKTDVRPATKASVRTKAKAPKRTFSRKRRQQQQEEPMAKKAGKTFGKGGRRSATRKLSAPKKAKRAKRRTRVAGPSQAFYPTGFYPNPTPVELGMDIGTIQQYLQRAREAEAALAVERTKVQQAQWAAFVPILGPDVASVKAEYKTRKAATAALKKALGVTKLRAAGVSPAVRTKRFAEYFETGKGKKDQADLDGITVADAVRQFNTLTELKSAAKDARAALTGQKRLAKGERKAAYQERKLKAAKRRLAKEARAAIAYPRGTRMQSLEGWPPVPPSMPTEPPADPTELALVPDPWRRPIMGLPDPGWRWTPAKKGAWRYHRNPLAQKGKKGRKGRKGRKGYINPASSTKSKGLTQRIPFLGKMFAKKGKGKRNPSVSLGEIAKVGLAAGGGYISGGLTTDIVSGLAGSAGLGNTAKTVVGGVTSALLTHFLLGDSTYYTPVMAGTVISIARRLFHGIGYSDASANVSKMGGGLTSKLSNIAGTVTGAFGGNKNGASAEKEEEAMGAYGPSDDELLSSIDAGVGEYVEVPLQEYVEVPLQEYVEVPLQEYVEVPLQEYVEVPLGEEDDYMMSYSSDPSDGLGSSNVYALADEYTQDIPGLDYGELTEDELEGFEELADDYFDEEDELEGFEELADDYFDDGFDEDGSELEGFEELADAYTALADDIEEAEDLGAFRKSNASQNARWRAAALRRQALVNRRRTTSARQRQQALGKAKRQARVINARRARVRTAALKVAGQKISDAVRKALLDVAESSPASTGSRQHFAATYASFRKILGAEANASGVRRAFLVSYRAATKGRKAAASAAAAAGVPKAVAAAVAAPAPSASLSQVAGGAAGPARTLPGGGLVRRVKRAKPRFKRIRKAGQGGRTEFGGIFARSLYGRRGRWDE